MMIHRESDTLVQLKPLIICVTPKAANSPRKSLPMAVGSSRCDSAETVVVHGQQQQQQQQKLEELSRLISEYTIRGVFSCPNELTTRYSPLLNTIIAAEGIICAGKSTFLKLVGPYLKDSCNLNSSVLCETPNRELLAAFYKDMKRYALTMQIDMLRQRQHVNDASMALAGRKDSYGNSSGRACIVWNDRSLWGDAVFATLNYTVGNMTRDEFNIYLSILQSHGPYVYDFVVFFDVEAARAHYLNQEHRKDPAEAGIPQWYFEKLRLAYYMQLRDQALSGRARIIYIYNEPWAEIHHVLDKIIRAPSTRLVRDFFDAAPALNETSSSEDVSEAFGAIRTSYDAYYNSCGSR